MRPRTPERYGWGRWEDCAPGSIAASETARVTRDLDEDQGLGWSAWHHGIELVMMRRLLMLEDRIATVVTLP
jgi:hypothetical protein